MKTTTKYDIEKVLVLSTAHMTEQDNERLLTHTKPNTPDDMVPCLSCDRTPFGFLINIDCDTMEELETSYKKIFSEGFCKSLELAVELKVQWVKFDQDGDILEELPDYEW